MHSSKRTTPNAAQTFRNPPKIVLWLSFCQAGLQLTQKKIRPEVDRTTRIRAEGSVLVIHDLEVTRQNGRGRSWFPCYYSESNSRRQGTHLHVPLRRRASPMTLSGKSRKPSLRASTKLSQPIGINPWRRVFMAIRGTIWIVS